MLSDAECYRAIRARDERFDGRIFTGVKTTGVYCRPVCRARLPLAKNVEFYPSAAAAEAAGFRPCRRCRPESAPGSSAWNGAATTVNRALRLIEAGALDEGSVSDLAARLGVGDRHLRRLMLDHVGVTPIRLAQTRRLHVARQLLDETSLTVLEAGYAAGFASASRFQHAFKAAYGCAPGAFRKRRMRRESKCMLRLSYRPPLQWERLLEFFALRQVPGLEQVDGLVYRRALSFDASSSERVSGVIAVSPVPERSALRLTVPNQLSPWLRAIVLATRRVFDLATAPSARELLAEDPLIASRVAGGLMRIPGAYSGFEVAVRALLGQQISVRAATTLVGKVVRRYGTEFEDEAGQRWRSFPSVERLASETTPGVGMVASRWQAVVSIARRIAAGDLDLSPTADPAATRNALRAIPGVGPWTAEYICLRGLGDPDAFPAQDLVLRRALTGAQLSTRELESHAEAWRPYRGHAVFALWSTLEQQSE